MMTASGEPAIGGAPTTTGGSLAGRWFAARVPAALAVAVAAVLWLAVEALSPESVGPIALWPLVGMTLLLTVPATLLARLPRRTRQLAALIGAVLGAVVAIRGLSYAGVGALDSGWLADLPRALILRSDDTVMPAWVPIILTAVVVWQQGGPAPGQDEVRSTFRLGALALVGFAIAGAWSGMAPPDRITAAAVVFFAAALLALTWSRDAEVHPGGASRGGLVPTLTGIGATVGIVLIGLLLAAFASPQAFDTLIWLLSPVFWLLRMALFGIGWLVFFALYPIFWLLERLSSTDEPPPTQEAAPQPLPSAAPEAQAALSDETVPNEIRAILAVVVLVALALLVLRVALRKVAAATDMSDVEQHSELDLHSLLRRRRHAAAAEPDLLAALRSDPRYRDTVAIREIYATFLRAAAGAGLGRSRAETARGHARRVASSIGLAADDVAALAAGYGPVRYGAAPATPDQRRAVESAWDHVRPGLAARRA